MSEQLRQEFEDCFRAQFRPMGEEWLNHNLRLDQGVYAEDWVKRMWHGWEMCSAALQEKVERYEKAIRECRDEASGANPLEDAYDWASRTLRIVDRALSSPTNEQEGDL